MFRLGGKVALIRGSTRGLGFAMAEAMIARGAHVVVNGCTDAAVLGTLAELDLDGRSTSGMAFDVADTPAPLAAIDTIVQPHGPIDIFVDNAGINHRAPIDEFDEAAWRSVLSVHLDAL